MWVEYDNQWFYTDPKPFVDMGDWDKVSTPIPTYKGIPPAPEGEWRCGSYGWVTLDVFETIYNFRGTKFAMLSTKW